MSSEFKGSEEQCIKQRLRSAPQTKDGEKEEEEEEEGPGNGDHGNNRKEGNTATTPIEVHNHYGPTYNFINSSDIQLGKKNDRQYILPTSANAQQDSRVPEGMQIEGGPSRALSWGGRAEEGMEAEGGDEERGVNVKKENSDHCPVNKGDAGDDKELQWEGQDHKKPAACPGLACDEEDDDEYDDEDDDDDDDDVDDCEKLLTIRDFKFSNSKQRVSFSCNVMSDPTPASNGFIVVVADNTSAIDCYVKKSDVGDFFHRGAQLMLHKARLSSSSIVFVTRKSEVTETVNHFGNLDCVIKEAFGYGEAKAIQMVKNELQDNSWFAVCGKVVQKSDLSRKELYDGKKILTHRLVQLKDGPGVLDLDVWGEVAERIECGQVLNITACKKNRKYDDTKSSYTTTRKSEMKVFPADLFPGVKVKRGFSRGTLKGISLGDVFQSCLLPNCFYFELSADKENKMHCRSCNKPAENLHPDYVRGDVDITVVNNEAKLLKKYEIFWPQLKDLFEQFNVEACITEGRDALQKKFLSLVETEVKYRAYGNVKKFKRISS